MADPREQLLSQLMQDIALILPTVRPLGQLFPETYLKFIDFSKPVTIAIKLGPKEYDELLQYMLSNQGKIVNVMQYLREKSIPFLSTLYHTGITQGRPLNLVSARGIFWNEYIFRRVEDQPELIPGLLLGVRFVLYPSQRPRGGAVILNTPVNLLIYKMEQQPGLELSAEELAVYRRLASSNAQRAKQVGTSKLLQQASKASLKVSKQTTQATKLKKPYEKMIQLFKALNTSEPLSIRIGLAKSQYIPLMVGKKYAIAFKPAYVSSDIEKLRLYSVPKVFTVGDIIGRDRITQINQLADLLNKNVLSVAEAGLQLSKEGAGLESLYKLQQDFFSKLLKYSELIDDIYTLTLDERIYVLSLLLRGRIDVNINVQSTADRLRALLDFLLRERPVDTELGSLPELFLIKSGQRIETIEDLEKQLTEGRTIFLPAASKRYYTDIALFLKEVNMEQQKIEDIVNAAWLLNAGKPNQAAAIEKEIIERLELAGVEERMLKSFANRISKLEFPTNYFIVADVKRLIALGETTGKLYIVALGEQVQVVTEPVGAETYIILGYGESIPTDVEELTDIEQAPGETIRVYPTSEEDKYIEIEAQTKTIQQEALEQQATQQLSTQQQAQELQAVQEVQQETAEQAADQGKVEQDLADAKLLQAEALEQQATQQLSTQQQAQELQAVQEVQQETAEQATDQAKTLQDISDAKLLQAQDNALQALQEQMEQSQQIQDLANATAQAQSTGAESGGKSLREAVEEIVEETTEKEAGEETSSIIGNFLKRLQQALFGSPKRTITTLAVLGGVTAILITGLAQRKKVRRDIKDQIAKQQMASQYTMPNMRYTPSAVKVQANVYSHYYDQELLQINALMNSFGPSEIVVNRYRR